MNYYQLLGIKEDATKEEITRAYHRFARRYHPDKNEAANAEEKFRAYNEAYKILKDEKKRELYDRFDLPQVRNSKPRATASDNHHRHSSHNRHKHDERFFTGSSESYSEKRRHEDELERIRRKNSELLDEANAKLRNPSGRSTKWTSKAPRKHTRSGIFVGEIMPEKSDEEYEKIVLERLRALGRL